LIFRNSILKGSVKKTFRNDRRALTFLSLPDPGKKSQYISCIIIIARRAKPEISTLPDHQ